MGIDGYKQQSGFARQLESTEPDSSSLTVPVTQKNTSDIEEFALSPTTPDLIEKRKGIFDHFLTPEEPARPSVFGSPEPGDSGPTVDRGTRFRHSSNLGDAMTAAPDIPPEVQGLVAGAVGQISPAPVANPASGEFVASSVGQTICRSKLGTPAQRVRTLI